MPIEVQVSYKVTIDHDGKKYCLGIYNSLNEAKHEYNEKSIDFYGEKAKLLKISNKRCRCSCTCGWAQDAEDDD